MRLIDADIAINMISDEIVTDTKVLDAFRALGNINEVETLNMACERHIHMIEQLPTVDAVEVVRCFQCKYAKVADYEDDQDGYVCQFHKGSIWFSGDFCSQGRRRENGKIH